jgi:hypothetical protein
MGLDMYLYKKHYYGGQYKVEEKGKSNSHSMKLSGKFVKDNGIDVSKVTYIMEDLMYWRKVNAIHNWFIRNCVHDGVTDDCSPIYVSYDQLKELVDTCHKVLVDPTKAEELLPTGEGFFFGGTAYDEYYFDELKRTVKELEEHFKKPNSDMVEYEYQASW